MAYVTLTPALVPATFAQTSRADKPLYKDASQPVDARVEDLLKRMTLEEKVQQMVAIWLQKEKIQTPEGEFDAAKASQNFPAALGQISRPYDRRVEEDVGPEVAHEHPLAARRHHQDVRPDAAPG